MGARRRFPTPLAAFGALAVAACTHAGGEAPPPRVPADGTSPRSGAWSRPEESPPAASTPPAPRDEVEVGFATWYGARFAGHKTANGERFDPSAMTAAHRTLPFGTWVEVRRVDTGAAVRVRITDRGPFGDEGRVIDLSRGAADKLGIVRTGVARVELRVVVGP